MRVGFFDVVDLLRNYIRGGENLELFRDRCVELRLSGDVDGNALQLLRQIEVRYADFSDVSVEEALLKSELQMLLRPNKWMVLDTHTEASPLPKPSWRVQGFSDKDQESSNTPILVGAA